LFCHKSQTESMGTQNIEKWIRNKCEEMASDADFTYAEGFHRVKIPL
jgi:hypothetical protein